MCLSAVMNHANTPYGDDNNNNHVIAAAVATAAAFATVTVTTAADNDDNDQDKKTHPNEETSNVIRHSLEVTPSSNDSCHHHDHEATDVTTTTTAMIRPTVEISNSNIRHPIGHPLNPQMIRHPKYHDYARVRLDDIEKSFGETTASRQRSSSSAAAAKSSSLLPVALRPRNRTFPSSLHDMLTFVDAHPDVYVFEPGDMGVPRQQARPCDIIKWEYHGRSFVIYDKHLLTKCLLPMFFPYQTEGYPSFQRQLNLYGFLRIIGGSGGTPTDAASAANSAPMSSSMTKANIKTIATCYYHEMFLRTRPDLCPYIVRSYVTKRQAIATIRHHMDPSSEPNFDDYEPLLVVPAAAATAAVAPATDHSQIDTQRQHHTTRLLLPQTHHQQQQQQERQQQEEQHQQQQHHHHHHQHQQQQQTILPQQQLQQLQINASLLDTWNHLDHIRQETIGSSTIQQSNQLTHQQVSQCVEQQQQQQDNNNNNRLQYWNEILMNQIMNDKFPNSDMEQNHGLQPQQQQQQQQPEQQRRQQQQQQQQPPEYQPHWSLKSDHLQGKVTSWNSSSHEMILLTGSPSKKRKYIKTQMTSNEYSSKMPSSSYVRDTSSNQHDLRPILNIITTPTNMIRIPSKDEKRLISESNQGNNNWLSSPTISDTRYILSPTSTQVPQPQPSRQSHPPQQLSPSHWMMTQHIYNNNNSPTNHNTDNTKEMNISRQWNKGTIVEESKISSSAAAFVKTMEPITLLRSNSRSDDSDLASFLSDVDL